MTVPAANRLLDLVETFSRLRRPMSVTALAKEMQLPLSSCHGLVKTLAERGYLADHEGLGGYYFTKRLEEQARRIGGYDPLPDWIHPALVALRDSSKETVLLAKLSENQAVYVDVLQGVQSVRYMAEVGDARPLHATAVGKALLGGLDPARREQVMRTLSFGKRNAKTIADRETLSKDIQASLARGWFFSHGEYLPDVTALAIPLQLTGGMYAVVVTGPSFRMGPHLDRIAKIVKDFARDARKRQGS